MHGDIVPRHTRHNVAIIHLLIWLVKIIEVLDSGVGVVLSRPKLAMVCILRTICGFEASGLVIGQLMLGSIPTTEA
jgi:hypothetical protein